MRNTSSTDRQASPRPDSPPGHSSGQEPASARRVGVVRTAAAVAVVGAAGAALLTVGHAGITVPVISALGPGGSRPVWPAAIAFAVGTAMHVAVAVVLVRSYSRWAWTAGMAVFCLTVVASLVPFRGAGSVVGAVVGLVGAGLLATPAARAALPRRGEPVRKA